MGNVQGAYCEVSDLRTGDLPAPEHRSAEQYIKGAAEEIEAALGHLYVTPLVWTDEGNPKVRPGMLWIKKINWLLASGRFLLDVATAGEQDTVHAYGNKMLNEALMMLNKIVKGEFNLVGATQHEPGDEEKSFTGPAIFNEDATSMVEEFYVGRRPNPYGLMLPPRPVTPYSGRN